MSRRRLGADSRKSRPPKRGPKAKPESRAPMNGKMSGKVLCSQLSLRPVTNNSAKGYGQQDQEIWVAGDWLYFYAARAEAGSWCCKIWRRICRKCKVLHPKFSLVLSVSGGYLSPGTTITIGAKLATESCDGRLAAAGFIKNISSLMQKVQCHKTTGRSKCILFVSFISPNFRS